jgi:outer membrane protein TolC
LIEEALLNNPEILAARLKWEAFKEKIPQAYALEDPMFSFGIVNLPTNFSFRDEDMTSVEFSISQKIPFPGKRPLMKEMAEIEAEAVAKEIQTKVHQIMRDVTVAYFELSHIERTSEVTQRNEGILEGFAKIAESRYSVGEGIQQDVVKAHVEISRMVDELIMLDQRRKAVEAKLNALLDRSPDAVLGKPEEVVVRKFPYTLEELQTIAVDSNPTLQAMKKMIESKEKAYALAKKDYYPDFKLLFAYGARADMPDGTDRRNMLTGMVEVNIPIFYKSKQDRKVAEARVDLQAAEAQYRAMKNEVFYMITEMATMIQRIERQIELYKTGIIPQTSLQIESALSAYRVNKADFMTLLDSRMTLYKYELEYHQALTELEKNAASLGAAIGKRFDQKEEGK